MTSFGQALMRVVSVDSHHHAIQIDSRNSPQIKTVSSLNGRKFPCIIPQIAFNLTCKMQSFSHEKSANGARALR